MSLSPFMMAVQALRARQQMGGMPGMNGGTGLLPSAPQPGIQMGAPGVTGLTAPGVPATPPMAMGPTAAQQQMMRNGLAVAQAGQPHTLGSTMPSMLGGGPMPQPMSSAGMGNAMAFNPQWMQLLAQSRRG